MTSEDLAALLAGDSVDVAPLILGMSLSTEFDGVTTEVVIGEVEAYRGADDPASHAYRGETPRNSPMFGAPGTLYVYRSYGIHWCMNVTCGPRGVASAVLLRGGWPTAGIAAMEMRRGRPTHLADGPGKLTQALGVTGEHTGTSLLGPGPVRLRPGTAPGTVEATTRIGISKAKERPWRFVVPQPP